MKRSVLTALVIMVLGVGTLAWGTDVFQAFTDEGARRYAVRTKPQLVPDALLQDQNGKRFRLHDLRGRLLAVEFVYVNCPTVCVALGQAFQQLRDALPPERLGRDVMLLSISFDPQRDVPARLTDYAQRHTADGAAWRIVRIEDADELQVLLKAFGIVVIPDGFGGFEHNAALHLVDRSGRLMLIEDFDQPQAFAAQMRAAL